MNKLHLRLLLMKNHVPVYELIRAMGCSHGRFYCLVHNNFSGNTKELYTALKKVGVKK